VLFNASYNEQVFLMNKYFLLNTEKNFGADPFCRFREKCKKRTLYFRKKTSLSQSLINNQLNYLFI